MLVACKYEEMYAPEVGDFAYITDNAFTKSQILEMEQVVLRSLKFQLGRPLPLHFLRRASKVASVSLHEFTAETRVDKLQLHDLFKSSLSKKQDIVEYLTCISN